MKLQVCCLKKPLNIFIFSTIMALILFKNYSMAKSTRVLKIDDKNVHVEIADTDEKRSAGLMHRKSLAKDHGMLFIFENEQPLSFWMKNTFIPLSIAFINSNCVIVDIQKMDPQSLLLKNIPNYISKKPAKYALEVNQGWFSKNKITVGYKLSCKNKKIIYTN